MCIILLANIIHALYLYDSTIELKRFLKIRLALQESWETQAYFISVLNPKHPNYLIYKYFKPDVLMHYKVNCSSYSISRKLMLFII